MAPPIKIFVCSSYNDLVSERQSVIKAIEQLQFQHESMEYFGARSGQPIETCLAEVASSNMLVVLVGYRYGSLVPGKNISYSEAEYQEGYRLEKPCLIYMRDENIPTLPKHYESDPDKLRLLHHFKEILNERHTVAKFQQPEDLAERVQSDLLQTIEIVEGTQKSKEEAASQRTAFFSEVQALIEESLKFGFREAVILSALRSSLNNLQPQQPSLVERLSSFIQGLPNLSIPSFGRKKQPWVFFSYSRHDQAIVAEVAEALSRFQIRVWIDQYQISAGDTLLREIQSGLSKADAFVIFASQSSLNSKWVEEEMKYFITKRLVDKSGPRIIPVVLDDVELPAILRDVVYIDLRQSGIDETARQIASAVWRISPDEVRSKYIRK